MKSILQVLLFILFTIFILSCTSSGNIGTAENIESRYLPDSGIKDNTLLFIDALKGLQLGNQEEALLKFQKCTEINPEDGASRYEIAKIHVSRKNIPDALREAELAANLEPDNVWYKKLLSELYSRNGLYTEYLDVNKDIVKLKPNNIEFLFNLASAYLINGYKEKAIEIYNRLEKQIGINDRLVIQKKNLYLSLDRIDDAENELKKLISEFPMETKYYAMLAEFYIDNGKDEKALEIYRRISQINPEDPYIHISMSDYYRKRGDNENAHKELIKGFANAKLEIDTKIQILLAYYTVNELFSDKIEEAFELTEELIDAHPNDPKAISIYADLLYQNKELEKARNAFLDVIAIDSSRYGVWEQLLFIENELGNYKAIKNYSVRALELFPQQPMLYLFAALSNFQLKNFRESIRLLELGLNFVVDNEFMLEQFYSYLGDAYNELHHHEESDRYYELVLEINPENSVVLNNYAYYLSLRNEKLEKAETLAKKAVELDPENSANLDTYGWVLYKSGKYEEAEIWIKKALEKDGEKDDTLLEHYGDVLFKLGKENEALNYWKKAGQNDKGSELLDKKIEDGKLYE